MFYNAISVTDFPRTARFPILDPRFYPFGQTMPSFPTFQQQHGGRSTGQQKRKQKKEQKKKQTKENKRVYAPAAMPVIAVPAEELRIDGLPPGMDHVVIDRPEVPEIPTPTPTATINPSSWYRYWRSKSPMPTPTAYPVGIALGMFPVPKGG